MSASFGSVEPVSTADVRLERTLRWQDAFALAMAVSGGLFASFGFTMGAIGVLAALALWAAAAAIGAIQNFLFAEMAAMFPDKPGGVAVFVNEAWRSRFAPAGAVGAFAYWFGWSAILAIVGAAAGALVQAQWFPEATWTFSTGLADPGLAQLIGAGLMLAVLVPNLLGIQPSVLISKVLGALLLIPFLVFVAAPIVSGEWDSGLLTWGLGGEGADEWGGVKNALVWLFVIGWTAYGTEMCAAFAPEYRSQRDTRLALQNSGIYTLLVFALVPLGIGGLATQEQAAENPNGFFVGAFESALGGGGVSDVLVLIIVGAFVMGLNASLADGSRALLGSAEEGLTPRQFLVLNRHRVPARAMVAAVVLNLFLIFFVSSPLAILVAANIGYLVAIFLALTGFVLLRRDRPDWPRPFRLGAYAVPLALILALYTAVIIAVGITSAELTGYGGTKEVVIGIAILLLGLVLYVIRRVVQDGQPLRLREPAPRDPTANAEALRQGDRR